MSRLWPQTVAECAFILNSVKHDFSFRSNDSLSTLISLMLESTIFLACTKSELIFVNVVVCAQILK